MYKNCGAVHALQVPRDRARARKIENLSGELGCHALHTCYIQHKDGSLTGCPATPRDFSGATEYCLEPPHVGSTSNLFCGEAKMNKRKTVNWVKGLQKALNKKLET